MASGKTTSLKSLLASAINAAAFVFDSPMANYDEARTNLESAIQSGFDPLVVYVHRPFDAAVKGAISRISDPAERRAVSRGTLGPAHFDAQKTFLRLASEFGCLADFAVVLNEGKIGETRVGNIDDLKARLYDQAPDETERPRRVIDSGLEADNRSKASIETNPTENRLGQSDGSVAEEGSGQEGGAGPSLAERLGLRGGEAERKAQMTVIYSKALKDALASGKITNAEFRAAWRSNAAAEDKGF